MKRRQFTGLAILVPAGALPGAASAGLFSETDAAAGVRTALERGASSAVALLGRNDGFLGNPKVRIELPGFLKDAAKLLKATGQGKRVDELVTSMNRAAEAAVPEAKALLFSAVKSMSVDDASKIVKGGETSVRNLVLAFACAPPGRPGVGTHSSPLSTSTCSRNGASALNVGVSS